MKRGAEIEFITAGKNDERLIEFKELGKMVKYIENIKIDKEDEKFLKVFLDYPFLHTEEFVRYVYYVRDESNGDKEEISLYNVDLIKGALNLDKSVPFSKEVFREAIITSAEYYSYYNLACSNFRLVKDSKFYNLYLVIGEEKYIVPNMKSIYPKSYSDSTNRICLYPFKFDKNDKIRALTSNIEEKENILFYIPGERELEKIWLIKRIFKELNYSKKRCSIQKVESTLNGTFYKTVKV